VTGVLEALQSSWLAQAIGQSQGLTAALSAVHLLGFALVLGSALVSNLRMTGVLLAELPATQVTHPASRNIAIGLLISAATGALLFMPRARGAAANPIFQLKLTLVVLAAIVQFVLQRKVARRANRSRGLARVVGVLGILLWTSAALAGCGFILLE
jgi:hypothetical protein